MTSQITRRDFINGVAVAVAGATGVSRPWAAAAAEPPLDASEPPPGLSDYPPRRAGLRGSHVGSFEAAHRLRDGAPFDLSGATVSQHYDLVVVGGGLSGLAAAYFYRQRHPKARVLILETNDDFGGHAKRNEFEVDGRVLLGYGGTQSIDSPKHKYDHVSRALLTELGIDLRQFNRDFDQEFTRRWGLNHAVFFKREVFGTDRLVRQNFGRWDDWDEQPRDEASLRAYIDAMPLSERARGQLFDMYWSERDVLPGKTREERQAILDHTSYSDFIRTYWQADDDVVKFLQTRTHGLWAIGIDAIPASYAIDLPGLKAQKKLVEGEGSVSDEPYIYHFPDGNASIARLLVRRLVPGSAPGQTMDDIVQARFDYSRLDLPENAVRIRLNSTAVEVRNVAHAVEVAYVKAGEVTKVAARHCVLACYHAMMPYIAPEIGPAQSAALHANVRAPLVYVNVVLRNWHAWKTLGVSYITNPGGTFEAYLDFPVSMGSYHFSHDPGQPIVVHLEHMPTAPNQGLTMREQFRAGRMRLYTMTFADFEREIRDELTRMLGPGGFDFDRDVAAITVNRWPHGYSYTPTPLSDDPVEQAHRAALARTKFGRVAIANADSGWDAYTNVAITQAHRAVLEL